MPPNQNAQGAIQAGAQLGVAKLAGLAKTAAAAKATAAGAGAAGSAAAGALASFGVTLAFAAVLFIYSNWQANKERAKQRNRAAQREINLRGEDAGKPIPLLYGYTGQRMLVCYANAIRGWNASNSAYAGALGSLADYDGKNSSSLTTALDDSIGRNPVVLQQGVIGFGEIEELQRVLVDDKNLEGELAHTSLIKKMPDGPVADPMGSINDRETAYKLFDKLTGLTCLHWQRSGDPQYGGGRPPSIYAFVKGRKLRKVLRTGDGTQASPYVYALSSSREFSNNSVLVLMDYLLEQGIGAIGLQDADLDLESWHEAQEIAGERVFTNRPDSNSRPWLTVLPRRLPGVEPGVDRLSKKVQNEVMYFVKQSASRPAATAGLLQDLYHEADGWTRLDAGVKPVYSASDPLSWWVRVDYDGETGRDGITNPPTQLTAASPPAAYPVATPATLVEEAVNSGLAFGSDFIRYQYDGAVRTDLDSRAAIQQILETMPGAIFWRDEEDSKFRLSLGKGFETAASQRKGTIDDSMLSAPVDIAHPDANDKLNSLEISFPDMEMDFATNVAAFPTVEYDSTLKTILEAEDGDVLLHDSDTYEGIVDGFHAHSAAGNYILQSRRPRYQFRTSMAVDYKPGDVVRLKQFVTGLDLDVRIQRKEVQDDWTISWEAVEFQTVDYQWMPRGSFDPGELTEPDLSIPAPTAVSAEIKEADSNLALVTWAGDIRNVEGWEVARIEGATGELGIAALFATELSAPAAPAGFYSFTGNFPVDDDLFTDAMGQNPVFASIDVNLNLANGAVGYAQLIFRDDDSGSYPAGPHLKLAVSRYIVVMAIDGIGAWGVPLHADDTSEPYSLARMPDDLVVAMTSEAAKAAGSRAKARVALLDSDAWTGGTNWEEAFGRFADGDASGWTSVGEVKSDEPQRVTDVIERGTHYYFYRARALGIGGGYSAWAYSALSTFSDNLAVPDVGRPATGPEFHFKVDGASGVNKKWATPGTTRQLAAGIVALPAQLADGTAWIKTYDTVADDGTVIANDSPDAQALTHIHRIWLSNKHDGATDSEAERLREYLETIHDHQNVLLYWEGLEEAWVYATLENDSQGDAQRDEAVPVQGIILPMTSRGWWAINVVEPSDDRGRILLGPRHDLDAKTGAAALDAGKATLVVAFSRAQDGKTGRDGVDASAFVSNVSFVTTDAAP